MKKLLAVILALLLIMTMGTPVFAAPSFSLSRNQFFLASTTWTVGTPYLDEEQTVPNYDYVKYEIRAGNIYSLDYLEYIENRPYCEIMREAWYEVEDKEGGEPYWELSGYGNFLNIEPGSFILTRSSVSDGAVLNLQERGDAVNAVWEPLDVTPIATRTRETIDGVRYRVTQRATMANCIVSGSIQFSFWDRSGEHIFYDTIPEGCEGFLVAGTVMFQEMG